MLNIIKSCLVGDVLFKTIYLQKRVLFSVQLRMAQWQRLRAVCRESDPFQQRLSELYNRVGFPIKIRSMFSPWIEAQDW